MATDITSKEHVVFELDKGLLDKQDFQWKNYVSFMFYVIVKFKQKLSTTLVWCKCQALSQ